MDEHRRKILIKHIIIIGTGMAGLVAAHELVKVGYKVTILEAQDRIKGRVKTIVHSTDLPDGIRRCAKGLYSDGKYSTCMFIRHAWSTKI